MNKTTLKIDGMACTMCEAHIKDTIRKAVPGARKLNASFKKGEAAFLTEEAVDLTALREAINKTGYTLLSGGTEPYVKRGLFG